jgi:two-component system, OmpR family, phosphate regulon sensor histidine kinase PhoR
VHQDSIKRGDYLLMFATAAAPGAAAGLVLYGFGIVSWSELLGCMAIVALVAAILALIWARDLAKLHRQAAAIASDTSEPYRPSVQTPAAAALSRTLEEGRRRAVTVQRALEMRALDAERLIDALPEPVLVLDHSRRILHANLAAEQLLGPALSGRNLVEAIRSPDVIEGVERALVLAQSLDVDFDILGPVQHHMRARLAPLVRGGGRGEAVVLVLQDLTAARRAEQMRVDFVANVSHELRTPLASLTGFIETLQGPAHDDPAARERFLGIMGEQTHRMGRLVDDLLSLSRIELEEHNPPSDRLDLAGLVKTVLQMLEPIAQERAVVLQANIPDDLPQIIGDGDQVEQVLRNLVENAIKYGRVGGHVQVSLAVDGHAVRMAVQDDGEGIAQDHLHRLTERFYRVDAARSRQTGGTGLGMAIVKHIVNRHRGRLVIDSTPGQGSRFTVSWPQASQRR